MSTRTGRLSGELLLRYGCAGLVTTIAAAGAQLVVSRNDFILGIIALSFAGTLVSLFLRLHGMRVAGVSISRPLWNALTSLAWFGAATLWTLSSLSDLLAIVMSGGATQGFWLRFGAGESLGLLMQVFLLFSAFRSFALISDKDATLATVPSFSVLLLLIPVHKGIEVVFYFLLWTLCATVLFALDHRSELARAVDGRVPAVVPGQDVRLAARGLVTVLACALVAAFALSYFLTSRNPDDRSAAENQITGLAGRLAQFALQSSGDSNSGAGPQRQIDFSSGPSLPSQALLWKAGVLNQGGEVLRPQYFRLFTLARYNGSTWTQIMDDQKRVPLAPLNSTQWPYVRGFRSSYRSYSFQPRVPSPGQDGSVPHQGFDLRAAWPETAHTFGRSTRVVGWAIESNTTSLGFAPLLPGARSVVLPNGALQELRVRSDGAVELGFIAAGQRLRARGDLPALAEYGFVGGVAPAKLVAARANAPELLPAERTTFLQHPALSNRLLEFAEHTLAGAKPDDSNLRRAQRLALAIQEGATYTLRPPTPPQGSEATDFFLFDGQKRGYCTHFASALTVLCRSQGIPARVVSGFAVKEYDGTGQALLRDANAHAWTEVWIDHWGWALVDATPAGDRGDNAPNWLSLAGDGVFSLLSAVEHWGRARVVLLSGVLAIALTGIYAFRRRARLRAWWARRRNKIGEPEWSRREIIAAYERASNELARRFRPRAAFETPDEWLAAAALFAAQSPRSIELPLRQLRELTGLYLRARYAPLPPESSAVVVARELAGRLKWKKAAP